MELRYGKRTWQVQSGEDAANMWDIVRQEAQAQGLGPDDMESTPVLVKNGKVVGWISWNASVWRGKPTDKIRRDWIDEVLPMVKI